LSESEREIFPTLVELPIARIKTAFAVSRELGVSTLTLEQWSQIYRGTLQNWNEVGGPDQPIILLGREEGEALLTALQNDYPLFGESGFAKSYTKEDQMLKSIGKIPGAIGFSSKSNLMAREELIVLDIKDLNAGLRVALVYDAKNEDAETVQMMRAFIQSDQWRKALEEHDFLPVTDQ
jgi:phosphate transport system substrate-binding protein